MNMKRVMMAATAIGTVCSSWADTETVGDYTWTYRINGDTAEIYNAGSGTVSPEPTGAVTIPSTLGGKLVTSIGNSAFEGCWNLTGITIPGSVTNIGEAAFLYCDSLRRVTMMGNGPTVGAVAFEEVYASCVLYVPCGSTGWGVEIPGTWNGLRIRYLTQEPAFTIDDGLLTAVELNGATSVTIPDGVTNIGESVFADCDELTSITIPAGVTSIGAWAFHGCRGLTSVTIPAGVTRVEWGTFASCSGLTSVTIPDSVTNIDYAAFLGCSSLVSVTIPDSVTSIGESAFEDCSGLTSVTIPDSVTSIGRNVFLGCDLVWDMDTVPGVKLVDGWALGNDGALSGALDLTGVRGIGHGAFWRCSDLTCVTIPSSVTSIGPCAFGSCSGLTSVTIPEGVTSIGESAFEYCSGLASVTISGSVTNIGAWAFEGCCGMNAFIVADGNPQYKSVDGLLLTKEGKTLISVPAVLTSVTIPSGVMVIGDWAFEECKIQQIEIPSGVTSIGESAFEGCSSLTSVTIPNSVTSIGEGAFGGCSGLTSVTIPDSVTSIGESAFYCCSGLTSVTIPDSVTNIEYGAFWGCGSLMSVTIPSSVTNIGPCAFGECRALTSITIPEGVASIGFSAFQGCFGLTAFAVSADNKQYKSVDGLLLTKDGETLISVPGSLTSVTIPPSVTSIEYEALMCPRMDLVVAPRSLEGDLASIVYLLGVRVFYYDGNVEDLSWCVVSFNVNGGENAVAPMSVPGGYAIGALPRPQRPRYAFTGWFTSADGGTQVTAETVVTADMTLYAHWKERGLEITYELYDSCGDGWNGNAIMVVNAATGEQMDCLTIEDGDYNEGAVPVAVGMQVRFEWVSGDYEGEVSFTVKGINDEVILSGSSGGFGDPVTYVVPGGASEPPSVTVDDTRMEEPVVNGDGTRTIAAKAGETLVQSDVASVKIASPTDPSKDITAAYKCELDSVNNQIVVTLAVPELAAAEEEKKDSEDATGLLEDVAKVDAGKIAALPTPDTTDPANSEEVGALPIKMYKGLWYQAWWGDDLGNLSPGTKFRADGTQTHIGVIKQTGSCGFYQITVSEQ